MSLADIKSGTAARRGFTIVELLIVVVVIAILAAITIVSYNGITTRANASAAKSLAATWQKKIELYQAEVGAYPHANTLLNTGANITEKSYYITADSLTNSALTSETGKTRVLIKPCGHATAVTASNATGVRISYYNYEATSPQPATVDVGTCGTVSSQNF